MKRLKDLDLLGMTNAQLRTFIGLLFDILENLQGLVKKRTPEIRRGTALTPDVLGVWDWWCVRSDVGFSIPRWSCIHRTEIDIKVVLDVYPVYDGQPWRPVKWKKIERLVKKGKS